MTIYIFGEGLTEKKVYEKLQSVFWESPDLKSKYIDAEGKRNLNKKVIKTVETFLGVRAVRCVIMRDLDEGETEGSICQSITAAFQNALQKREIQNIAIKLEPHKDHPNVYVLQQSDPDLRLAVHIASDRWKENFKNCTMDDYLLKLSLQSTVLGKLSDKLGIEPERLSTKITHELPELLQSNGIILSEAKNYLQIYAAINKISSLTGFVSKVMENSSHDEIREIFQPLRAAFEFVGGV